MELFDTLFNIATKKRTIYEKNVDFNDPSSQEYDTQLVPEQSPDEYKTGGDDVYENTNLKTLDFITKVKNRLEGKNVISEKPHKSLETLEADVSSHSPLTPNNETINTKVFEGDDLEIENMLLTQKVTKNVSQTQVINTKERQIYKAQQYEYNNYEDRQDIQLFNKYSQPHDNTQQGKLKKELPSQTQLIKKETSNMDTQVIETQNVSNSPEYSLETQPIVDDITTISINNSCTQILGNTASSSKVLPSKTVEAPTLKLYEVQQRITLEEENNEKAVKEARVIDNPKRSIERKKQRFTKQQLLNAFNNSDEDSENDEPKPKLTTIVKNIPNNAGFSSSDDDEFKIELKKTSNDNEYSKPSKILQRYTQTLKTKKVIELDSDDEKSHPSNNLAINPADDIDKEETVLKSASSKAALLGIRAKKSKKKNGKKGKKQLLIKTGHTGSLQDLLQELRQVNRNQILKNKKELIEKQGLTMEELEKEHKEVENLLEQEIQRNLRIRAKEKEREKASKKQIEQQKLVGEESGIIDEVPESDDNVYVPYSNEEGGSEEASVSDDSEHEQHTLEVEEDHLDVVYGKKEDSDYKIDLNEGKEEVGKGEDDVDNEEEKIVLSKKTRKFNFIEEPNKSAPLLLTSKIGDISDNDLLSSEDTDEEDEAAYKEKMALAIRKNRNKEKKKEKLHKEMKKKGIYELYDMEAEESEDEWHGLGGADGEESDEYDPELEKMVDDYTKQNFNPDEIRKLIASEEKAHDEKMVNKILHDIKNGGFRKRGRGALDIELSDDEDDELKKYRLKKRELLRKRMLENKENRELAQNNKRTAFFNSILNDDLEEENKLFAGEEEEEEEGEEGRRGKEKDSQTVNESEGTNKVVLTKDFVSKTLSFLTSKTDDLQDEFELSRIQHDSSYEIPDLHKLKQNSSIKSFDSKQIRSSIKEHDDDLITSFGSSFVPSAVESFISKSDINSKFKNGSKSVKISKSYRAVGSSKASITYFGKKRQLKAPSRTEKEKHFLIGNRQFSSRLIRKTENTFE
ncbi:uncharacterized protein SCODWIG_00646 [Saccharomycodes ludwigii]|uniref:DNA replication checkpoint mediator MRC1 domain-containing protein n=1 Tax=Saccharomycodes ludwigii TaxID=36035 RepID=A0A376B2H6_9ASCO|nr:uncharacterized protein SCODWIG_00646 [Saccharomycodes ludwigii]